MIQVIPIGVDRLVRRLRRGVLNREGGARDHIVRLIDRGKLSRERRARVHH